MSTGDVHRVHYDDLEFDDQLALLHDVPFTGVIYAHYADGGPEIEFNYVDGLPSGLQRRWHPSGQLEAEWDAVRGRGSNWSRVWYPNGKMKSERIDEDQFPILLREWSETGELTKDIKRPSGSNN